METKKSEIQNSETKLEEILRQTLVYEKSYVEEFGIQRYAALVLKALEYAWEKLLQSLKEMDLSSESTDFSGHAIGNIINTLQERKNRIDQAKQKYEEWCNEIYTPKIEEVESKRKNLQGGLEDFEQALKDKQGESAQELRKLIGQLKRETQELRKLIERLKRETMDINLFQEGESVQGLENFNQSLAEQASKVDTQVEKIKEKISEIEKAISMEEGKLKTRQKDLHRKTEEQKNLYETIETHRVEHQIEESIEAIREYLKQVDQQTQWQEAITAWKTQRKTTFTGLLNEVERLKQQWETILPEVSLPQIQIQSLPEEMLQNTHTDMENTINGIEQWLSQVEQTYTERIGQMQEKLGELTKECETLQKEMESVNTFIGVFRGRIGEIDMQVKKVEGARNELQKFQRLAELTGVEEKRGKEALPGLKTWLYQFILKKMLGNASPYLREFTDGRLDFAPSEDDGMEKIRMVDHTYSKVRNVNDLSGGEKFMAALSLALGLTDLLIQFEKGATRPNFMFIDEGFGTLDAERLEKVVARLKAYAEKADILLGIVSHRREMHELAPVRIHVTHDRTRRGSKVEIIPQ
jgi:exonuclease SbcC